MPDGDDNPHILSFCVEKAWLAMDLARVLRVTHYPAMVRPPGSPAFLEGFVDFRGRTTPVLSLVALFRLQQDGPGFYAPVVFFRNNGEVTGLLADRLGDIVRGEQWRAGEVGPDRVFNDVISAVAHLPDDTEANLLDPDRLLLEEERARVADLREQVAERLAQVE